jgi:hypothetical protein
MGHPTISKDQELPHHQLSENNIYNSPNIVGSMTAYGELETLWLEKQST